MIRTRIYGFLWILGLTAVPACHRDRAGEGALPSASVTVPKTGGIVAVTADQKGFTPSSITLEKATPVTLRFTRTSNDTCADKVVFPELALERALPLNQPVDIEVPTGSARTLGFQCGMGMFKSAVVIR